MNPTHPFNLVRGDTTFDMQTKRSGRCVAKTQISAQKAIDGVTTMGRNIAHGLGAGGLKLPNNCRASPEHFPGGIQARNWVSPIDLLQQRGQACSRPIPGDNADREKAQQCNQESAAPSHRHCDSARFTPG